MTWTVADHQFMSRAVQLAKQGRYTCDPNPRVGCVITKNQKILAEGWHAVTGEAHAEVNALNNCNAANDTTVYLTLEPCSHHGRTPPCVEALISAKVAEVVIAMVDPNPSVSGAGIKRLQSEGITVRQGLLESEAKKLNPGFIKRMVRGLPFVSCKMAMSLDGRTALANGKSQWISSAQSRCDVHQLRAASSAVLSNVETVIQDDAALNARGLDFDFKQPIRVIIDRKLKLPITAKLLSIPGEIIIYTETNDKTRISELENAGAKIVCLSNSIDWLHKVFTHMAKEEHINEVMVETGATFAGVLIEAGLIDQLIIYMAPILLGSDANPLVKLKEIEDLSDAKHLTVSDVRQIGPDIRYTLTI